MKLELLQDGVLIWTRTYAEAVIPGTAVPPPVTPPVVPIASPAPLPAGWTLNMNPLTYEPPLGASSPMQLNVNTTLTFKFRAGPNQINVHPIMFKSSSYPGMTTELGQAVTSSNLGKRDYVISTVPGSMTAVSPYGRKVNQGLANSFSISFNNALGTCPLNRDTQYYLNVKASDPNTTVDYMIVASPTQ